ncbi:hypothetical protein ACAW74_23830 [Fibrella sp. WM1]|uniref:hypothetical protein n=1 Tax=Fibrella musci TaxID=3242485 RepID=UPI0035218928
MKTAFLSVSLLLFACLNVTAQTTPTATDILTNYIKAIGGQQALLNVRDIASQATMALGNAAMQVAIKKKAPRQATTVVTNPKGEILFQQVSDGKRIAEGPPQKIVVVTNSFVPVRLINESLFPELLYTEAGVKSAYAGKETVNGKEVHKLTHALADGSSWSTFFDVATGLKVQVVTPVATGQDIMQLADYRDVGGVKFPFSVKLASGP